MLSTENNELITRVGPGTPMGDAMRRYWIPALMDFELPEPDCDPVRARLLGENLVAFRDSKGRVGLLPDACPPPPARQPLLRFQETRRRACAASTTAGSSTWTASAWISPTSPTQAISNTRCGRALTRRGRGGNVIWAYLGPPDLVPPPPEFEWTTVPDSQPGRHQTRPDLQLGAGR